MSDEPGLPGGGEQRELLARLRTVVEAKDTEIAVLRAELAAALERERRQDLRIAELERWLGMDSTNSGTPSSKESIEARERRKAERKKKRDTSERERRADRKRGGQPGHRGSGLSRDLIRRSGRPLTRRRSARHAGLACTARRLRARRGRRSGTCGSPGG